MGGSGSGNRWQVAGKGICEQAKRIDLRYLRQNGMMEPGYAGSLKWTFGGEPCGDIQIRTNWNTFELIYRTRSYASDEWMPVNEHIFLAQTAQNYGGKRQWFLCPACRCRCLVLFGGSYFRCRSCSNLAYQSQRQDAYGRALSKARKLRARLGDRFGGIDDLIPPKPRGMHWRTYERLSGECERLENFISLELMKHLQILRNSND